MGARVYLPTLGRFLQVDPVEGGTENTYTYPANPVNGFDLDATMCMPQGSNPFNFFSCRHGRQFEETSRKTVDTVNKVNSTAFKTVCGEGWWALTCLPGVGWVGKGGRLGITFTRHAAERMAQRGVSQAAVNQALRNGEKFKYYHDGAWKMGYYDARSGVFVGTYKGKATTVINKASRNYIDNLKRGR